jgi:hypothetical protein
VRRFRADIADGSSRGQESALSHDAWAKEGTEIAAKGFPWRVDRFSLEPDFYR